MPSSEEQYALILYIYTYINTSPSTTKTFILDTKVTTENPSTQTLENVGVRDWLLGLRVYLPEEPAPIGQLAGVH